MDGAERDGQRMGAFMLSSGLRSNPLSRRSARDGTTEEAGEAQRPDQDQRHGGAAGDDADHALPRGVVGAEGDDRRADRDAEERRRERVKALRRGEIALREREPGAGEAAGRAGHAEGEANEAGGVGEEREEGADHQDRDRRPEPAEALDHARRHEGRERLR